MWSLRKPSPECVRAFVARQAALPFSYPTVGATRSQPPAGYDVDHNRTQLGTGRDIFERACAALRRWEMFRLGWVELCWPEAPIKEGVVVAILARPFGLWSLNAARVVYTIDEPGPVHRFGFAYGTLPDHAESGEERFRVEWHRADDTVWYDLLAFSRPSTRLGRVGYPYARRLQKRFARDSLAAMGRAARG